MAQRLVRSLCRSCRLPRALTPIEAVSLGRAALVGRTIYEPASCVYCGGRGYSGRLGLFEMLSLDEQWARRVADGADEGQLLEMMRERNVPMLLDDGIAKLLAGQTTLREIQQAISVW